MKFTFILLSLSIFLSSCDETRTNAELSVLVTVPNVLDNYFFYRMICLSSSLSREDGVDYVDHAFSREYFDVIGRDDYPNILCHDDKNILGASNLSNIFDHFDSKLWLKWAQERHFIPSYGFDSYRITVFFDRYDSRMWSFVFKTIGDHLIDDESIISLSPRYRFSGGLYFSSFLLLSVAWLWLFIGSWVISFVYFLFVVLVPPSILFFVVGYYGFEVFDFWFSLVSSLCVSWFTVIFRCSFRVSLSIWSFFLSFMFIFLWHYYDLTFSLLSLFYASSLCLLSSFFMYIFSPMFFRKRFFYFIFIGRIWRRISRRYVYISFFVVGFFLLGFSVLVLSYQIKPVSSYESDVYLVDDRMKGAFPIIWKCNFSHGSINDHMNVFDNFEKAVRKSLFGDIFTPHNRMNVSLDIGQREEASTYDYIIEAYINFDQRQINDIDDLLQSKLRYVLNNLGFEAWSFRLERSLSRNKGEGYSWHFSLYYPVFMIFIFLSFFIFMKFSYFYSFSFSLPPIGVFSLIGYSFVNLGFSLLTVLFSLGISTIFAVVMGIYFYNVLQTLSDSPMPFLDRLAHTFRKTCILGFYGGLPTFSLCAAAIISFGAHHSVLGIAFLFGLFYIMSFGSVLFVPTFLLSLRASRKR